jgi:hypothetical protein
MFGGVGKAGWATILASGFLLGGASMSASAADLGGDCCGDLEERISELEATRRARAIAGQAGGLRQGERSCAFWDDGYEKNAYVVTNDRRVRASASRAEPRSTRLSANFKIEIGVRTTNQAHQPDDPTGDLA